MISMLSNIKTEKEKMKIKDNMLIYITKNKNTLDTKLNIRSSLRILLMDGLT
jgi:hypothetical protein